MFKGKRKFSVQPAGASAIQKKPKPQAVKVLPNTKLCSCKPAMAAVLRTVRKESVNKGRQFYSCTKPINQGCGFFEWFDNAPSTATLQTGGGRAGFGAQPTDSSKAVSSSACAALKNELHVKFPNELLFNERTSAHSLPALAVYTAATHTFAKVELLSAVESQTYGGAVCAVLPEFGTEPAKFECVLMLRPPSGFARNDCIPAQYKQRGVKLVTLPPGYAEKVFENDASFEALVCSCLK